MEGTRTPLGTNPIKPTPSTPVKEVTEKTVAQEYVETDGLDKPFEEKKKVTIGLVSDLNVSSTYRKVNVTHIPDRHDSIGSSIMSVRRLMASVGEINKYMPALLGISSTHPDFTTRVSKWFNNISVFVDYNGFTFDCGFNWLKKSDYLEYKRKEEAIENAYDDSDKSNPKALKDAIKKRVEALTELESTRYLYGLPINVSDYLIYRHCLLYPDVAKDINVVHFDNKVRFYIKDENKEVARAKKRQIQANQAKRNYLEILDDKNKFRDVFICYCASLNLNILANLNQEDSIKEQLLDTFASQEPDKFNKLFNNRNIHLQALIEEAISKGELIRSNVNQNIMTPEGNFIGGNMKEAIAYFLNPTNADFKKTLETKLKY
jgi:hypothetical protein|nr:MAG TPA: hypothetical protein [Crassvirales sp.]